MFSQSYLEAKYGYNQYNENNDMTQFYYDHKNIYMKGKQFGVNYLPFLL